MSTILGGTTGAHGASANPRGVTVPHSAAPDPSDHMTRSARKDTRQASSVRRGREGLPTANRTRTSASATASAAYRGVAYTVRDRNRLDGTQRIHLALRYVERGSGAVTVVDAHDLQFSSMAHADEDEPVCMLGLGVHILIAGATFNLHTRRASAGRLATRKT